ncbi:hypothetical protein NAC44_03275 [Allorhizobium sp. BGMRC 0089]|nr:hypothetical protein [Allorhizobium sonneratiae]
MAKRPMPKSPHHHKMKRPSTGRMLSLFVLVLVIGLSVFVASRLLGPYIVSSSLVRGSIERAIGRWSGHKVEIGGTPSLEFWPEPRITLPDVTISGREHGSREILAKIETLSASFGLMQTIMGHPVFNDFRLVHPHVFLLRDRTGRIDWSGHGLLSDAIAQAEPLGDTGQSLEQRLDAHIGTVTIEDGRIDIADAARRRTVALESIFGQFTWPKMSAALKGNANLVLGGVVTRVDFSSSQPLLLMNGKIGNADLSLSAPMITASFRGRASLMPARFASGALSLNLLDVPSFVSWTGAELPGTGGLKSISVDATLTADANRARLDGLTLEINDKSANGVVDITRARSGKPKLSGTLAFQDLDIPTLLGAFSLSAPDQSAGDGKSNLLDWLELDLTLSADQARFSPFMLTDVGASILATDGSAVFDIADSSFAGGTLTAHLEGRNGGFDEGGKLDLSISGADFAHIENKIGLSGPLPVATGSLTLSANTLKPIWAMSDRDIHGTLDLTAGPGQLTGFDMDGIAQLAHDRPFFKLQTAGSNALAFDSLTINTQLNDGAFLVRKGEIDGSAGRLHFSGVVPFDFKGLTLSAALLPPVSTTADTATSQTANTSPPDAPAQATGTDKTDLHFFIGGSWPNLIVSPDEKDR